MNKPCSMKNCLCWLSLHFFLDAANLQYFPVCLNVCSGCASWSVHNGYLVYAWLKNVAFYASPFTGQPSW